VTRIHPWLLVVASAIAVAACLSPSAQAAMTPSPIVITSCVIQQAGPFRTSGIQISYKNNYSVAATKVKFFVDYRGQRDIIVDKGTFSPGVKISHEFEDFSGQVWEGSTPDYCLPVYIKFQNGALWEVSSQGG
jgi:hypothetical protein